MKKITSILLLASILTLAVSLGSCGMTSQKDLNFFSQPSGIYVTGSTSALTYMTIPDTYEGEKVVGITQSAFNGCESLKRVTIPNTVTEIQSRAFAGCTSLKKVKIYGSDTEIGVLAFSGCTSLEKVIIGDYVTTISEYAFLDCTSLRIIKIADSVTKIGKGAFSGCLSLEKIVFEGTKSEWAAMSKGNQYVDIPEDAVVVCSNGTLTLKNNIPV
jgi:hypothetical protein